MIEGVQNRGSRHFLEHEFACPHCGVALVRDRLTDCLERARTLIGDRPIRIVSGYRCPVHNSRVGGARNSQHMYGSAADIPAGLLSVSEAWRAGFTGVGVKGTSAIHVDVRDGPHIHWTY
jgi:uncharacterized protein YcbK (DUF882 family)